MIRGFYSANQGLKSQQTYLNNIANNIANVNTNAFKPQQTAFSSLLYSNVNGGSGTLVATGSGAKVEKTGIDFTPGSLEKTDLPMDCALTGEGFFAIENKGTQNVTYTRNGAFSISVEGNQSFLVDGSGNYVLGADSNRIDITQGFDAQAVGIFNFSNPYGLSLLGNNQFGETTQSGQGTIYPEGTLKTGFLESSAAQVSREMVKMIEASKGFSFNAKILQATDEMEKIINQLR